MRAWLKALMISTLALSASLSSAHPAGAGLRLQDPSGDWGRWQSQLTVVTGSAPGSTTALSAVRLSGERLFDWGRLGDAGGLRARGALLLGPRSLALGAAGRSAGALGWQHIDGSAADASGHTAVPYVGVGYSAWWARSGLGLSADFGLVAERAGLAWRSFSGGASLEDSVRAMQLSPVLQVHLSFSF